MTSIFALDLTSQHVGKAISTVNLFDKERSVSGVITHVKHGVRFKNLCDPNSKEEPGVLVVIDGQPEPLFGFQLVELADVEKPVTRTASVSGFAISICAVLMITGLSVAYGMQAETLGWKTVTAVTGVLFAAALAVRLAWVGSRAKRWTK